MHLNAVPEIVCHHICTLGEGPLWDAENNRILWLDITKGEIHQINIQTNAYTIFNAGEMVGCIAPRESGGFIAGLENGIGFIDIDKNIVQHIANPEEGLNNRFNDGKCDAAGRFWAGTMAKSEEENQGNLYMIDANLFLQKKIDNVSISNGIAWNEENTTMYYINTPTNYVFAFNYNIETGDINNRRVAINLTHEQGFADGMSIDKDGNLWIAFYGGWRVACYNPSTGQLLRQIELPVENVTCCTFGGAGLTDLYITTASQNMSEALLAQQPHAGKLFVVKNIGVEGTLAKTFKG